MMKSGRQYSENLELKIRFLISLFMVGLVISGVTAVPIKTQMDIAFMIILKYHWSNEFADWIVKVHGGVSETYLKYPFMGYGTDWLAFAHLVIALAFIGPWRDPVRNIWVMQFGLIACIAVFPFAIIAGEIRGIPVFWRMIDCSFGIIGGIILIVCYRMIVQLERTIIGPSGEGNLMNVQETSECVTTT